MITDTNYIDALSDARGEWVTIDDDRIRFTTLRVWEAEVWLSVKVSLYESLWRWWTNRPPRREKVLFISDMGVKWFHAKSTARADWGIESYCGDLKRRYELIRKVAQT